MKRPRMRRSFSISWHLSDTRAHGALVPLHSPSPKHSPTHSWTARTLPPTLRSVEVQLGVSSKSLGCEGLQGQDVLVADGDRITSRDVNSDVWRIPGPDVGAGVKLMQNMQERARQHGNVGDRGRDVGEVLSEMDTFAQKTQAHLHPNAKVLAMQLWQPNHTVAHHATTKSRQRPCVT